MLPKCKGVRVICFVVLMLALVSQPAAAAFYAGKTISVVCPAPAGGGVSRAAAVFIKYMANHLEGNPTIIVKNLPGGGGLKALNFITDKGKPDGLTLYWGSPRYLALLMNFPGVRFSPDKLDYIGTGANGYVSLIRRDCPPGIQTASDILKTNDFKVAGQGPSSGLDLFSKLPLDLLGIRYKYIPGYKGQPQFNKAIRAKEVNFITTGDIGFQTFYVDTLVKDGTLLTLYYHSPFGEDGRPVAREGYPEGVENFIDFVQKEVGKKLTGPQFEAYQWICTYGTVAISMAAPIGLDKTVLSLLRKAHKATTEDPEFKAAYVKQFASWPVWGSGDYFEKLSKTYNKLSPEALAVLKKMTAKKKK